MGELGGVLLAPFGNPAADDAEDSRGNVCACKLRVGFLERPEALRYGRNAAAADKAVGFGAERWLDLLHQEQAGFRLVRCNEAQGVVDHGEAGGVGAGCKRVLHFRLKLADKVVAHLLRQVEHVAVVRVERAARHAACRHQLAYGYLLERLFRRKLQKRLLQSCLRALCALIILVIQRCPLMRRSKLVHERNDCSLLFAPCFNILMTVKNYTSVKTVKLNSNEVQ